MLFQTRVEVKWVTIKEAGKCELLTFPELDIFCEYVDNISDITDDING